MAITWQSDVEGTLEEASRSRRPVLLDFSAAPL